MKKGAHARAKRSGAKGCRAKHAPSETENRGIFENFLYVGLL